MIPQEVIEFARSKIPEFDSIYFECEWNGLECYRPSFNENESHFVGMPHTVLRDKKGNLRMATDEEEFEILDSLPDDE